MNHRIGFLALAVACALVACTTQPYQPAPLAPAQSEARFRARSLDSAELRRYMLAQGYPEQGLSVAAWGLRELTLAAFFYHPQLDLARAQLHEAEAAIVSAGARTNPGISAGVEHHSDTSGGLSPWTLGFSLDIPVETGNKREIRIAQASSLSDAARLDIGQTAWEIRSRLHSRWLDYLASLEQAGLLQRELEIRGEMVKMLESRLAAGMISNLELTNARLQKQKTQQQLDIERNRQPELKAALAAAAGLPTQALDTVRLSPVALDVLPSGEQLPAEAIQRAALLNRLDLRAALARYAAAESALKLEIAKQRPDFSLSPGYAFDQGDNRWSLGLSLLLALLNKNEGPIAMANAKRATEAASFDALQTRIIGEQALALARYRAALDEIASAQRVQQTQQQRYAQMTRQFAAGYSDRLELTGARLESMDADQRLLAGRINANKALAALEDAMQQPLDGMALPAIPEQKEAEK